MRCGCSACCAGASVAVRPNLGPSLRAVQGLGWEQESAQHRYGTPILVRADSAGSSHGFLAHIRSLRQQHLNIRFSVGAAITEPVRSAIQTATSWIPAVDADGDLREHAEVCEITGLFQVGRLARGHPVPGPPRTPAPLRRADLVRHRRGVAAPGSRHRHPTRPRQHPAPGSPPPRPRPRRGPHPHRQRHRLRPMHLPRLRDHQAWLQLALTGIDLLAWTQTLLLDGDLATAEPKNCVTGSCTSPPASRAPPAGPDSPSPPAGPGTTR